MAKKVNNEMEGVLAGQIPEYNEPEVDPTANEMPDVDDEPTVEKAQPTQGLGKLNHTPGHNPDAAYFEETMSRQVKEKKLSTIGSNILKNAEIRDGWLPVDRALLGDRDYFYPEGWKFYIRPATVEAIRNWSMIDDQNGNSVDDVFNEILKTCLAIKKEDDTPLPWYNVNSWDRFFFILLIRAYTFENGEREISYYEECSNCEGEVNFKLTYDALLYDMPDPEIIQYYDRATKSWAIDPTEFDVEGQPMTFYVPTLEKEANIKAWMISRLQENRNYKIDPVFIKFLTWIAPKISKDPEISKRQIKQYKMVFESWSIDEFSFWNDVIANITVTPSTSIKATCPSCGEEVTSLIRFQDGVRSLFAVSNRHKKFGSKSALSV